MSVPFFILFNPLHSILNTSHVVCAIPIKSSAPTVQLFSLSEQYVRKGVRSYIQNYFQLPARDFY